MLDKNYVFVFDKDGVITDTETFKMQLLENILTADHPQLSKEIIGFNRKHRGMYRSDKISAIFKEVIEKPLDKPQLQAYLEKFAQQMQKQLVDIELIPGVIEFIKQQHCTQYISSAAPEEEVIKHLDYFEINPYFEDVYASPNFTDKATAIREIQQKHQKEIIFFGDSLSDLDYAQQTNAHFFGITHCSDAFVSLKHINLLPNFKNAYEKIAAALA